MGMRLFVCEYVTGGGLVGMPLPPSLCREGDMMLEALVKGLLDLPAVEVVLTRDRRLPPPGLPATVEWLDGADPWPAWRRIAAAADAIWPIAPETGGALERLSELALETGRTLIGSRPDAVRLAGSKRAAADRLAAFGVPVVPSRPLAGMRQADLPDAPNGWVVKPDDGAGAEEARLFHRRADLARWLADVKAPERFVLQPYLPGEAASLSMLCRDGRAWLLSCNRQAVDIEDGRFVFRGGTVGGLEHRRAAYAPIAEIIAGRISGLWGYVGVDLVETADGPVVLEVNPRLTTSFVALRPAIGVNPAALVLGLLENNVGLLERPLRGASCAFTVEDGDG